jgi:RNA polymerase sigma-70 factor (ECF subfamily)
MRNDRRHISDDDAVLVASWRGGELASFEALVGKYQKPMFNIALRITGDYTDACEVVEDAFVCAYRGIDSFRGAARFSTWLTTIIVTHSRNRLQQVPEKQRAVARSLAASPAEDSDPPRGVAATVPPVPDQAAGEDMHRHMQECLGALLTDFREVLVLSDLQNVPCSEVGAILNIREATVKSRLCRAREMVKDCLTRAVGER